LLLGIEARLKKSSPRVTTEEDEQNETPAQIIFVRIVRDKCTVMIDSSGALLHRRGYRLATAKAPLRETLAASILIASGWDQKSPLIDPFCGSGTIVIEAAMLAKATPPGASRRFAFMDWPKFDSGLWEKIVARAKQQNTKPLPLLFGSDRDAGAITISKQNASRANVAHDIVFENHSVSAMTPPKEKGWIVTNPPYGIRVSEGKDLRNLYAQLGNVLREKFQGWQVAILTSDLKLLNETRLQLDTSVHFNNGGLSVKLGRGVVS
jgi:putative N6-adenine-specific DNA methylase